MQVATRPTKLWEAKFVQPRNDNMKYTEWKLSIDCANPSKYEGENAWEHTNGPKGPNLGPKL